jgi:hypothetical protein
MLKHANLPNSFWAGSIATTTYIQNRLLIISINNVKTLEEIGTQRKLYVVHLRIFGCEAYAYTPKEKQKKIDVKSIKCVFFGYNETSKAYRFYNLSNMTIKTNGNVVFNETNGLLKIVGGIVMKVYL